MLSLGCDTQDMYEIRNIVGVFHELIKVTSELAADGVDVFDRHANFSYSCMLLSTSVCLDCTDSSAEILC